MNGIIVKSVEDNSIAEELDIVPGDILLSINGKRPQDVLEYTYLISDEYLSIEIEKTSGEIWQLEIEKDYDENFGLILETDLQDDLKHCHNNCVFCFINQLPTGMRDSLYFKDDDTRLSFLYGNYVTLTNVSDEELDRVIEYKLEPINISVHTTNPKLRAKMLNNPKATNINAMLRKLYKNKVIMNFQIVLVPGYNDAEELDKTLRDLIQFYPYTKSISVVPVGITKYRQRLPQLRTFNETECEEIVEQIRDIQRLAEKKYRCKLVYPSDEFFLKGNLEIPNTVYYDDFPQLENGVGMASLFIQECNDALNDRYTGILEKEVTIITGVLAFRIIEKIVQRVTENFPQIKINLITIVNNYFGSEITVSGLITGSDIINQIGTTTLTDTVLFPSNMLRHEGDVFLDDLSVDEVSKKLNTKLVPVKIDGREFIEQLLF